MKFEKRKKNREKMIKVSIHLYRFEKKKGKKYMVLREKFFFPGLCIPYRISLYTESRIDLIIDLILIQWVRISWKILHDPKFLFIHTSDNFYILVYV